ncbi:MAG: tRNA (adenosine(37)-N6)-dimethylallyltransferase MiaA [Chloroflexi bacterium]|nr:tRNA (adenosine(37)-N6)-dimethylallyltransferase MiaA [Chloroflexota bacterium]
MATKVLVIVGPTGVGKSALAMRLARDFDGEIIGADSRQVYRYMSIGTAKPSDADRAEIPHHLVDIIEPDKRYSLALFLRQAGPTIHNAKKVRGRLPLVVGGTGQYIWGLLEGWQVPEVNPNAKLRETLEAWVESEGIEALYEELRRLDAGAAERIDGRNPRRVVRALEIALSRDSDATEIENAQRPRKTPPDYDAMVVGLTMERAALYARIDTRIDAQMAAGWLDEVRGLRERGYGLEHAALSGLGYAELIRQLDGDLPLDEAVQRIKYRTHRYARQQYNWFRLTDERIRWLDTPVEDETYDTLASDVRRWLATGQLHGQIVRGE